TLEHGAFVDYTVKEGEMFLLPAKVPHLNQRDAGSLGIVVHQERLPGPKDAIVWYCEQCATHLYRADYVFEDLRAQLPVLIRTFLADETLRTGKSCGFVMPADLGFM